MLIVYLCCAVVFLAVGLLALKHKAYRTNLPLFLVLWLLFLGFAVGSLSLLWHKTDTYALLFGALAIGMAICVVAVMNIRAAFVCDVPLEGVYQGFVEYPASRDKTRWHRSLNTTMRASTTACKAPNPIPKSTCCLI